MIRFWGFGFTTCVCVLLHYVGQVEGDLRVLGVHGVRGLPGRHAAQSPAQGSAQLCRRRLLNTATKKNLRSFTLILVVLYISVGITCMKLQLLQDETGTEYLPGCSI